MQSACSVLPFRSSFSLLLVTSNALSIIILQSQTCKHHPQPAVSCANYLFTQFFKKKQTKDGEHDRAFGSWSKPGSITVRSTKFDSQHVQIDHRQAGRFRGKLVPSEWYKDPTPEYWSVDTGSRRRTNLRLRSEPGQGDTSHQLLARENCKTNHADCACSGSGFMPIRRSC